MSQTTTLIRELTTERIPIQLQRPNVAVQVDIALYSVQAAQIFKRWTSWCSTFADVVDKNQAIVGEMARQIPDIEENVVYEVTGVMEKEIDFAGRELRKVEKLRLATDELHEAQQAARFKVAPRVIVSVHRETCQS